MSDILLQFKISLNKRIKENKSHLSMKRIEFMRFLSQTTIHYCQKISDSDAEKQIMMYVRQLLKQYSDNKQKKPIDLVYQLNRETSVGQNHQVLYDAIQNKDYHYIKELLKNNQNNQLYHAMQYAIHNEDEQSVRLIFQYGLMTKNQEKKLIKKGLHQVVRLGNENIIKDMKLLQIFDEATQIQQLVNQAAINKPIPQQMQNNAMNALLSGLLQLNDVAALIQANSRVAMTHLIAAMASASKQGIDNSQILETMNLLNSCVAMLEDKTPQSTLKSLMLLYLPWLPLPSGVGFELEVGAPPSEDEASESVITVLIQTKNYGNVKGHLTLTTKNSVDVLIFCTEEFPKELLHKRLMDEMKNNTIQTNIDIEILITKQDEKDENQAKVNLSATNEMNPYLLLMAHSFIRNTIIIDNNFTVHAA